MGITKRTVDAAEPRSAAWFLWDEGKGAIAGFGLRVSPGGTKSYVIQYRMAGAKADRRYTIGRHGPWTPDQARQRASELRRLVDTGVDPFDHDKVQDEQREQDRRDKLDRAFGKVADTWLESYRIDRNGKPRRASSLRIAGTVIRFMKSQFEQRRIDKIGRGDITAALDAIAPEKVAMRSSVFSYGRILWKWAYARELVETIPFAALRAPVKPESRERVLSESELVVIWQASRKIDYPFGPAFRLLLITGQRRSEVFGMRWEEIDEVAAMWTIPGDRTKNKQTHTVPLSGLAIAELGEVASQLGDGIAERWPKSGLVFSTNNKTPASGVSKAKVRLDSEAGAIAKAENIEVGAWRLHDLRRTMATALEGGGVNPSTIEAVLNHISAKRGKALGAYARYDYGPEKRAAHDQWARRVNALIAPKPA